MVTSMPCEPAETPGWVRVECYSATMAAWLLRAIVTENVAARATGAMLELPVAPSFRVDKEIKNIVTVSAKTSHYWLEHMPRAQQRAIAELLALLEERAREAFQPSPFFPTRVLAVLREREAANEKWAWSRLWRTAGGLASAMAATVVTMAILTFVVPGSQIPEFQNSASITNAYTAEAVVLGETASADDQLSDSDVLATLYESDDDVVK